MPKWLLEVLTQTQQWDLDTVLALTWGMAMDQEMEAMALALVEWEVMALVMVVWEEAMALVMVAWEEAMALVMVAWEVMDLVMVVWVAMALDMVAWEEAWAQEWEEAMAWTDAARRSMLKVHQILT